MHLTTVNSRKAVSGDMDRMWLIKLILKRSRLAQMLTLSLDVTSISSWMHVVHPITRYLSRYGDRIHCAVRPHTFAHTRSDFWQTREPSSI
ncbi:hypothetical protein D3C80_487770 [compost metagenome]